MCEASYTGKEVCWLRILRICDSPTMDRWAGALYGDPCRECSFAFSTGLDESLAYLAGLPEEFSVLLADAQGTERHPDLAWSVGSYVCHVADNLRIWAERLVGSAAGAKSVEAYDDKLLAVARSYPDVPLAAGLWSIGRAGGDWQEAVANVAREGVIVVHRERGEMHLEDIARSVTHDAFHHAWDIRRSLEASL
jgi:DinB superfamily